MKRQIPELTTDEQAEAFLDQDLSDLDFQQFKPIAFAVQGEATQVSMRIPRALLDAVKRRAEARGIPYTRYIRELMERDVSHG